MASALRALVGYLPLEAHIDFPEGLLISWKAKALKLAPGASLDDRSLHVVLIEDIGTLRCCGCYRGCWGAVNFELHA